MILVLDTETTGLYDFRLPPDHEAQPHLVQLAFSFTDDNGTERASFKSIVQPIGSSGPIEVPKGASDVHGITTEIAHQQGLWPTAALYIWDRFAQMADVIVAHNLKFDMAVIEANWLRHNPARKTGVPNINDRVKGARFCTMEAAAPIINLPPTERMLAAGFNKPKPPKLEEAVRFFFNEALDGAHDAMVDVVACRRVYLHLKSKGLAWP